MSDVPEPLVSAEVDLSMLAGFMLDVGRLLGSELVAISTGEEFKAAVLLWARAWHQSPAASLPDDDRVLASFAMVTPARWKKVKPIALRGFAKCSDGRLYHRVLAEDALKAWSKVQQRRDAIRKRYDRSPPVEPPNGPRTSADATAELPGTGTGTGTGTEERKEGGGRPSPVAARPSATFAFVGSIIRLNSADLEGWRKAFPLYPSLESELTAIDGKLRDSPPADGKWFGLVAGWLRKGHDRLLAERAAKPKRVDKDAADRETWAEIRRQRQPDFDPGPPASKTG